MSKKLNFLLVCITLAMYVINQQCKNEIVYDFWRWFMCCYFNDTIGGMTFIAYTNVVLSFRNYTITKLWKIELFMFGCGIFWEVITPLFRENTVADVWDIVAYMVGGFLYWGITRLYLRYNNREAKL